MQFNRPTPGQPAPAGAFHAQHGLTFARTPGIAAFFLRVGPADGSLSAAPPTRRSFSLPSCYCCSSGVGNISRRGGGSQLACNSNTMLESNRPRELREKALHTDMASDTVTSLNFVQLNSAFEGGPNRSCTVAICLENTTVRAKSIQLQIRIITIASLASTLGQPGIAVKLNHHRHHLQQQRLHHPART